VAALVTSQVLWEIASIFAGKSSRATVGLVAGKIRRELNRTPLYSLQQGLQAPAEWYRDTNL